MQFFFDLDGTILDTSQRYYSIYYNIVKDLGGSPLTKKVYWDCKSNKISEYEIAIRSHLHQSLFNEYNHTRINLIESEYLPLAIRILNSSAKRKGFAPNKKIGLSQPIKLPSQNIPKI